MGDDKEDKRACAGIRRDLLDCLNQSDCVRKEGHTPRECLQGKITEKAEECLPLSHLLFRCKRSQIDMRTRFRGKTDYNQ